jgi:hypothetical protein
MAGPRAVDGAITVKEWKAAVNAEVADGRKGGVVCFGGREEEIVTPHEKEIKFIFHEILNRSSELVSFCKQCYGKTMHYYKTLYHVYC